MVHEITDVLRVWKLHFENLGVPKNSPHFDEIHYNKVMSFVNEYRQSVASDDNFLNDPFSKDEVSHAVSSLNRGKAAGYDGLTAEHIIFLGSPIVDTLTILCNMVRSSEYVPICCRIGMQVPLFKAMDTCPLDPNNYRGITLLSIFNKIMEILIWHCVETWWKNNRVISDLHVRRASHASTQLCYYRRLWPHHWRQTGNA